MNQITARLIYGVVAICFFTMANEATAQRRQKFITRPKLNADAEKVELFAGVAAKQFGVAIVPTNEKIGNVLIENKTDEMLTVQLPNSIVGQQIPNRVNRNAQQAQPVGGGFLGGPLRDGVFSIPPKRIVQVQYRSVCLAHGWPTPHAKLAYRIMPVTDFTKNKTLQVLIHLIGTEKIHQKVAQAAAWHLTNNMAWAKLARETMPVGGFPVPYFTRNQLLAAQQLVAIADKQAKAKPAPKSGSEPATKKTIRPTK